MSERTHEYSVIDVATALHGTVTGSFGGLTKEQLDERAAWLQKQLARWQPSTLAYSSKYDACVYALAREALLLYCEREALGKAGR